MSDYLVISTNADLLRVTTDEVLHITSDGNYSTLVLASGEIRVVTMQLGQIEFLISNTIPIERSPFIRVGRSAIVNKDYIFYLNPAKQTLELSNRRGAKYTISASRVALNNLKELIENETKQ